MKIWPAIVPLVSSWFNVVFPEKACEHEGAEGNAPGTCAGDCKTEGIAFQEFLGLISGLEPQISEKLSRLTPPKGGRWECGELLPWLIRNILTALELCRLIGNAVFQKFLDDHVSGFDRKWVKKNEGARPCPCPNCSSFVWSYERGEPQHKGFKELLGLFRLWRCHARCKCGCEFYPLDCILGLGSHLMFPVLQLCCVYLGTHLSDGVASKVLALLTGIYVCPNTIASRVQEGA